jgi:hypothetical protein
VRICQWVEVLREQEKISFWVVYFSEPYGLIGFLIKTFSKACPGVGKKDEGKVCARERNVNKSINRDSYLYHLMDFLAAEVDLTIVTKSVDFDIDVFAADLNYKSPKSIATAGLERDKRQKTFNKVYRKFIIET